MPNIFLDGELKFLATGTKKGVADVLKAIKSNEAALSLGYEEAEDLPCCFYVYKSNLQAGEMNFTKIDDTTIECSVSGLLKVPVATSAVNFLIKQGVPLFVDGIQGNGWNLKPVYESGQSQLKASLSVSDKAPKKTK